MNSDVGQEQKSPVQTWPSVGLAYEFVIPSYQWMLMRLEAQDSRIHTLQAFAATVTLAVSTVAPSIRKSILFSSPWVLGSVFLFLLIVAIGIFARTWGALILANPRIAYDKCLHYSEWEFKKNALYWAGQHFDANLSLINKKARLVLTMTWIFAMETITILIWLISAS